MIRRVDSADVAYQAEFLVDTGATDSMAPTSELECIGITRVGHKTYELADGARHEYAFGLARIELMGELTAGACCSDRTESSRCSASPRWSRWASPSTQRRERSGDYRRFR
jgi:hypothetical protein